jgi:hypothetical protein
MTQQPLRGVTSLHFNQDQSKLMIVSLWERRKRRARDDSEPQNTGVRLIPSIPRLLLLRHGDRRPDLQCGATYGEGASW